MWNQLQKSADVPDTWSQRPQPHGSKQPQGSQRPQPHGKLSLNTAARALDPAAMAQKPHWAETSKQTSGPHTSTQQSGSGHRSRFCCLLCLMTLLQNLDI